MEYFIMLGIVVFMAIADFLTGFIKSNVLGTVSSKVMRTGGLKKFAEILIMIVSIVLEIGLKQLGKYYSGCEQYASVIGTVTAIMVFVYIIMMELISILENYLAICPEAKWASKLLKKLKNVDTAEQQ